MSAPDSSAYPVSELELLSRLRRMKVLSVLYPVLAVLALAGGLACAAALFSTGSMGALIGVAAGFAVLILVLIGMGTKTRKQFKLLLGESITKPVLEELFEVTHYSPMGWISEKLIKDANLIYRWDICSGSDFVKGTYRGLGVMYSDIHLQRIEESTDSEGHTTRNYVTVFQGQWLVCDFYKELAAELRLRENSERFFRKGYSKSKSDIETENVAFNEKFQILTSDGHTAFYVLTPHFMERILAADTLADAQSFYCFRDGKVHIALHSGRDSFELKGIKLSDIAGIRNKFRAELRHMTKIMDELLLNDRLLKA